MYAFGAEQLRKIADQLDNTNEGLLAGDLYAKTKIVDLNDNETIGWLAYDDNGAYGFIVNVPSAGTVEAIE